MVTVYHAQHTRSLRVLWTLAELGVEADVRAIPFPPRKLKPEYLEINPSGTVPTMIDGAVKLTESLAICEYLADKNGSRLLVVPGDAARPDFLQWLWYGESTLMVPMTMRARIGRMGKTGEGIDAVLADAREALSARLEPLERHLEERDFVAADRLTLADIALGYPLYLVKWTKIDEVLGPNVRAYADRLHARPAFQRAAAVQ